MINELEKPRFVFVVMGGGLNCKGVYFDEDRAKAAFYKEVAREKHFIECVATLRRDCGQYNCDECYECCKSEQEKFFPERKAKWVKKAKEDYDRSLYYERLNPSEENKEKVLNRKSDLEYVESFSHELEDETAVKDDFREYWLGPGTDELMDQLVEGKPDAWCYFHFHKIESTIDGLYHIEEYEDRILSEVRMQRMQCRGDEG